jgi:Zn finger protein HypA/HybF involved in hydrogenase expression
MRRSMPKTTYLIELAVDEGWFKAISELTADVHEGEVCEWVRVQAETETDENDCQNCEEEPKEDPNGMYCETCRIEYEETE